MEFSKVVGKIDKDLVFKAQEKLTKVFIELGAGYSNSGVNKDLGGGDCFIFALVYPSEHICTMSINTAATDGKRFYWNPKFVLKHSITGLRFLCTHEAGHAIYMHPQRRGSRNPKLWNIAVDYIVNGMVMDDCKSRNKDAADLFTRHLGRFMTLPNYAKMLKDPFAKVEGFEDIDIAATANSGPAVVRNPMKELTEKQVKDLEAEYRPNPFFFGDPDLADDMKAPEKIYAFLFDLLPKCPDCGTLGMYKKPKKNDKKGKSKDKQEASDKGDEKGDEKGEQKGDGEGEGEGDQDAPGKGEGSCCGGCPTCGDGGEGGDEYVDIFGLNGQLDDHIDTQETQEKLAKKMAEAIESAKRMAGHVPASFEDELGTLTEPKIRWQDTVRGTLKRIKEGNGRNNWNNFKSRPMFTGLMVPKRKNYYANFGCLIDTSGSMSRDDIAFGISQLQSLDEANEGTITPADCSIYWEDTVALRKCSKEDLMKAKITGRGGTYLCPYFEEYEERLGKKDFLIIITDGYLSGHEMETMQDPLIPVFFLITSECNFIPPFGKVFNLHNL